MTARAVLQVFDNYQKARIAFVQSVADLASHSYNVTCLENAGAIDLLRPLLTDMCPSIQQCAAVALGRLANLDEKIAQTIVRRDVITVLLKDIDKQSKYFKKAAMFTLRAIAKHTPEMAGIVLNSGGIDAMLLCMEDFDSSVKLAAAWAIGYLARHNRALAQATIDAGVVPLIILCLQEPEVCLKQTAASAIADIAKHGPELAQTIADCSGSITLLAQALHNQDAKLKRQVLTALSTIASHNVELAEACVESEVFPTVLLHINHACPQVSKAACTLVRDTVKHSIELAQLIVNNGGIAALLEATGEAQLPAIAALGYIAGHVEQLALAVAASGAVPILTDCLDSSDEYLQATTAWTLGQIGKHTSEHARRLAEANAFPKLLHLYKNPQSGEDLKSKCKTALKQTLQKCMVLSALEPLLYDATPDILKYVLGQFSKVLPNDPRARRLFVVTGGLKKVQEITAEPGSTLMEYILIINSCFPEEIVRFYSPGYPETLLEKVEQYTPQVMISEMNRMRDGDMQTNSNGQLQGQSPTASEDMATRL